MSTKAEVRHYVRAYLDVEEEDVPSALIDAWALEGFRRIWRSRAEWPGYETTHELLTQADVSTYVIPVDQVMTVQGPQTGQLEHLSPSVAASRFYDASPGEQSRAWSYSEGKLRLWPTPAGGRTYTIIGFRKPTMPADAGTQIDLPTDDAEDVLMSYVMYKAYLHQDEPDLAGVHKTQFDEGLSMLASHELSAPNVDVTVNGRRRQGTLPHRLLWPWE